MIALIEGAERQKTPNEIALNILLAALTVIFLLATATLLPFSLYSVQSAGQGAPATVGKETSIMARWVDHLGHLRLNQIKRVNVDAFTWEVPYLPIDPKDVGRSY